MTVSNSWLVNVSVAINTTVLPLPAFNNCMLVSIMPTQSSPYQCPPTSWGSNGYFNYTSLATLLTDFGILLAAAQFAGDILQANRFQWLMNDATAFFSQSPTPNSLYVSALAPQTSSTNYSTFLNTFTNTQNNWYAFGISDLILANSYSIAIAQLTINAAVTIPAGTQLVPTGVSPTAPYTLLQPFTASGSGTYLVPFYSIDATTAIPTSSFNAITPSLAAVTGVTNITAGNIGIPGITTATKGIDVALTALRTNTNQKKLFLDEIDFTQAQIVQTAHGNQDLLINCHSLNRQFFNITDTTQFASISGAALSAYFTNLFAIGVGMKPYSSMQLASEPVDPTINTSNIGTPGTAGSSTNLIGWNNNVYAGFGTPSSQIGLMQYGYMSSSSATSQVYLDQIVGADYIQFVAQTDLATYLISQQPVGGIFYNDVGIQQIVSIFKGSLQKAVNQNIIQPISNDNFSYLNYAQVKAQYPQNITNKIYNNMNYSGNYLSRIQRIGVNVNLSL